MSERKRCGKRITEEKFWEIKNRQLRGGLSSAEMATIAQVSVDVVRRIARSADYEDYREIVMKKNPVRPAEEQIDPEIAIDPIEIACKKVLADMLRKFVDLVLSGQ